MVEDIVGSSGVDGTDFTTKLWATERPQSLKWIAYTTSSSQLVVYRAYIIRVLFAVE